VEYDYLVENQEGDRFILVPRDDSEHSLDCAVKSEKMKDVLSEIGLKDGFLSQYMAQLAETGSVSKDLLLEEGSTIVDELDVVYQRIKRVVYDEYGFENDITMMGEILPEEEISWWAIKSWYGVRVLDCHGRTEPILGPFGIKQPVTPHGSFIRPMRLDYLSGITEVVEKAGLNVARLTCFVDQYSVACDETGKPVHVDDARHITIGTIDNYETFKPYATILKPYIDSNE